MLITIFSWIAMILSLTGNIFVTYKMRSGFLVWNTANIIWITVSIVTGTYAQLALFFSYLVLNTFAYYKWGKKSEL